MAYMSFFLKRAELVTKVRKVRITGGSRVVRNDLNTQAVPWNGPIEISS